MSPLALPLDMEEHPQSRSSSQNRPPNFYDVEIIEIDDDDDEEGIDNADSEEDDDLSEEDDEASDEYEDEDEDYEDEDEEGEPREKEANGYHGTESSEEENSEAEERERDISKITTGPAPPGLQTSIDVHNAMRPLRNTANRVVTQIETFAQNLDRFRRQAQGPNDPQTYREACTLVRRYQKIAQDCMAELSKSSASRKPKQSALSSSRGSMKEDHGQDLRDDEQLRRWELEAETWDLLLQLLSMDDPDSHLRSKQAQETILQDLHRYSTDREVWEGFLKADHFARECAVVLGWLEKTAKRSTKGLDSLISAFETDADRGQGLWAHGWLYTKEAIKGAKRLRSWPQPLEPDDPGITASLLSTENKHPLITQLDPDAVTRQHLGLQKQDEHFEEATWLTCWKMLRLGQNWSQIREWSQERLENWRSVSICGSSEDTGSPSGVSGGVPFLRMMNFRSQASWRAACSNLANNPKAGKHERAVYALLAGEVEPALAACQGWNDYIYVFYNHIIMTRYSDFCKRFHRKLSYAPGSKATITIDPPSYDAISNFLENLKKSEQTSVESKNPFSTIQAAILSRSYDTFFFHQANATATAARDDKSSLVPSPTVTSIDDPALIAARDDFAVRITTHLFVLAWSLNYSRSDSHFLQTTTINVIAYIEFLRSSGNMELIPLYASFLPRDMTHSILAKVLVEVVKPEARLRHVKLIKNLGIDFAAVLQSQWYLFLGEANKKEDFGRTIRLKRSVIRQANGPGRIGGIKKNLVGRRVSHADERLIRCLHWHLLLDGHWSTTCSRATYLYKRFIEAGRLASARELWMRVRPFETLSNADALQFDQGVDIEDDAMAENGVTEPASPAREMRRHYRAEEKKITFLKLHTMRELEQLIAAFDALEDWADLFDEYQRNPDRQTKEVRKELQQYIDKATETVQPLCGEFLKQPATDVEEKELNFIRGTYLPEIIFAYHSALYFAGHTLAREILVQCMTLATTVGQSTSLISSFMMSNRLPELVDAFALSSMALMGGKDTKLKKKLPGNATLDIWKVKPLEGDDTMLNLDMD